MHSALYAQHSYQKGDSLGSANFNSSRPDIVSFVVNPLLSRRTLHSATKAVQLQQDPINVRRSSDTRVSMQKICICQQNVLSHVGLSICQHQLCKITPMSIQNPTRPRNMAHNNQYWPPEEAIAQNHSNHNLSLSSPGKAPMQWATS